MWCHKLTHLTDPVHFRNVPGVVKSMIASLFFPFMLLSLHFNRYFLVLAFMVALLDLYPLAFLQWRFICQSIA
jgi:hypothetical protein